MALIPRTTEQIAEQIWSDIKSRSPLQANLDASYLGLIVKTAAAEIAKLELYIEELQSQSNLSTASGSSLDTIGANLGVPRLEARAASSVGIGRAVRFVNNGATSVLVPSGSRVWSSSTPQRGYFTVEGATVPAGSYLDVNIAADSIGESYNVGVGVINRHNVVGANMTVSNIFPLTNGSSRESDDSYRSRIRAAFQHRYIFSSNVVEELVRGIPGVRQCKVLSARRGGGTYDVFIFPYLEQEISSVINAVEEVLVEYTPVGTSFIVNGPVYRPVDIEASLTFSPTSAVDKVGVRSNLTQQVINFIENLPIETGDLTGVFYPGQLESLIRGSNLSIINAQILIKIDGVAVSPTDEISLAIGDKLTPRSVIIR